jgi:hypothetical protein
LAPAVLAFHPKNVLTDPFVLEPNVEHGR